MKLKKSEKNKNLDFADYELIKPNHMQKKAMDNLNRLRALVKIKH